MNFLIDLDLHLKKDKQLTHINQHPFLNSNEYKNLCNEMNAALVYLLENEEEYDNLISRLEQGVDTSLMYLQEAINNGEDFCAKND